CILDLRLESLPSISKQKVKRATILEEGDVIMTDASEDYEGIGKSVEVINISERHIVAGLHTFLLRDKNQVFTDGYRGYLHRIESVKQSIDRMATGLKVYGISKKNLKNILLPVPGKKEQRAIAQTLSDVDGLIAALDLAIAKKRNIKTATMQELLTGKKRLPGFGEEWQVKRLGDIANITMGQSPSSQYYNSEEIGLPLIQGNADIKNRRAVIRKSTSEVTKKCYDGDIILSVRAPVGEVAKTNFDACIGRGVSAIFYPNDFLYHYLIFREGRWSKLSKGSTFDSINSTEIKDLEIKLPVDLIEQRVIATILSDMDAEIAALEKRCAKTQAMKQGMMQELLTGKTRLIVPNHP
ncbi:MAG: restriction endonuclease subunit S, partial [Hormoscilla sp. SP12CHS1]|nr:restriction endonuclease subunit S [Hormoscilla sp. SP12CHS1]